MVYRNFAGRTCEAEGGDNGKSLTATFPESQRCCAQVPHHVAREVGGRRKAEVLRNPSHGKVLHEQRPRDFAYRKEVDEVARPATAHLAADFRQIFGRDA